LSLGLLIHRSHPEAIAAMILAAGTDAPEATLKGGHMISGYSDQAANERTYLAWVRTGLAVIAFGLVIEKFDLFLLAMSASDVLGHVSQTVRERLSGHVGRYESLALIIGGLLLIVLATVRFVRTARLLEDSRSHPSTSVRLELAFSAILVLLVSGYALYLALASSG
jgi:putative membrane protein